MRLSYYGSDFNTHYVHRTHNPKFCSYTRSDNEDENLTGYTRFGFLGLKDNYGSDSKEVFDEMRIGQKAILSDRVLESMPNLVRSNAEGIMLKYTTLEPPKTTSLSLEMGEPVIHKVENEQMVARMSNFEINRVRCNSKLVL